METPSPIRDEIIYPQDPGNKFQANNFSYINHHINIHNFFYIFLNHVLRMGEGKDTGNDKILIIIITLE